MIKKTLYFGNPAYLSLRDRQLVIRLPEVEKAKNLPPDFKAGSVVTRSIEDVGVVVLDNRQITITQGLLEALLENNCAVITCDSHCMPAGLLLPLSGNYVQSERFRKQLEATPVLRKGLWQQTIKAKIENQAKVLANYTSAKVACMGRWVEAVRSGDSTNREARAASYYWIHLFQDVPGLKDFVRDREGIPPNNLLNYGYSILRGVVARGLVGSGLLPTFGLFHRNKYNAYCLADDVMEPYRPFVDELVFGLVKEFGVDNMELNKEMKAKLLTIPTLDVVVGGNRRPLMVAVSQTTASLYKCFSGELRKIAYPEMLKK